MKIKISKSRWEGLSKTAQFAEDTSVESPGPQRKSPQATISSITKHLRNLSIVIGAYPELYTSKNPNLSIKDLAGILKSMSYQLDSVSEQLGSK